MATGGGTARRIIWLSTKGDMFASELIAIELVDDIISLFLFNVIK
jgi:hypothetical protein|tara:strand:+ start:451 stop:585 length:135 start_codon:yes stop_codon:yes gene_type:complete